MVKHFFCEFTRSLNLAVIGGTGVEAVPGLPSTNVCGMFMDYSFYACQIVSGF